MCEIFYMQGMHKFQQYPLAYFMLYGQLFSRYTKLSGYNPQIQQQNVLPNNVHAVIIIW